MKYVKELKDLDNDEHYAVLIFTTVNRYTPAYDDYDYELSNEIEYRSFDNKDELLDWVNDVETDDYTNRKKPVYKIILSKPIQIKKTVTIEI